LTYVDFASKIAQRCTLTGLKDKGTRYCCNASSITFNSNAYYTYYTSTTQEKILILKVSGEDDLVQIGSVNAGGLQVDWFLLTFMVRMWFLQVS
jgi:hypothetical protein